MPVLFPEMKGNNAFGTVDIIFPNTTMAVIPVCLTSNNTDERHCYQSDVDLKKQSWLQRNNSVIEACAKNIITMKSVCNIVINGTVKLDLRSTVPTSDYEIPTKIWINPPEPTNKTKEIKVLAHFNDTNGKVQKGVLSYWTQKETNKEIVVAERPMTLTDGMASSGLYKGYIPLNNLSLRTDPDKLTINYAVRLEDDLNYTNHYDHDAISIEGSDKKPPYIGIDNKSTLTSRYGEGYDILLRVVDNSSGIDISSIEMVHNTTEPSTYQFEEYKGIRSQKDIDNNAVYESTYISEKPVKQEGSYIIRISDNENNTSEKMFLFKKDEKLIQNPLDININVLGVDVTNQTIRLGIAVDRPNFPVSDMNRSLPLRLTYDDGVSDTKEVSLETKNSTNNKSIANFAKENGNKEIWNISNLVSVTGSEEYEFRLDNNIRYFPFDKYEFGLTFEIPIIQQTNWTESFGHIKPLWVLSNSNLSSSTDPNDYTVSRKDYELQRDIQNTSMLTMIFPIFAIFALVGATPLIKTSHITERLALTLGVAALTFALQGTINSVKPETPLVTITDYLILSLILTVVIFTISSTIGWWLELSRPIHDVIATIASIIFVVVIFISMFPNGEDIGAVYLAPLLLGLGLFIRSIKYGLHKSRAYFVSVRHDNMEE